jgi:hypothetical protein
VSWAGRRSAISSSVRKPIAAVSLGSGASLAAFCPGVQGA